jgi:hypothetical protein
VDFTYHFGELANLYAEVKSEVNIQEGYLNIYTDNNPVNVLELNLVNNNIVDQNFKLEKFGIDPFTRVYYWFVWQYNDDQTFTSPSYWFDYIDDRFEWKFRQTDGIEIYWQTGDEIFIQRVYNTAKTSLESVSEVLEAQIPSPLRIIIYPNASDLQSAIQITGPKWVAGHASPEMGKIFISLPEGQNIQLEMERQLPHEIMHLAEFQIAGPSYLDQPTWLKEGLASSIELYPNPDYQRILNSAYEIGTLIPVSQFCNEFPADATGSFQAYAQSVSFTKYLQHQYGNASLRNLFLVYRNGLSCEEGFNAVYGLSLDDANINWQVETFGFVNKQISLIKFLPAFIIVILLILIVYLFMTFRNKKGHNNEL